MKYEKRFTKKQDYSAEFAELITKTGLSRPEYLQV